MLDLNCFLIRLFESEYYEIAMKIMLNDNYREYCMQLFCNFFLMIVDIRTYE